VRAHAPPGLEVATVDAALADASRGSGHTYRVSPSSWCSSSQSRHVGSASCRAC
jgi:hypothetical protein